MLRTAAVCVLLVSGVQALPSDEQSPVVINLGFSKTGTSSFVNFVATTLGLVSFHNVVAFERDLSDLVPVQGDGMEAPSASMRAAGCVDNNSSSMSYPDYAAWQTRMNSTGLLDTALSANVGAWADMPQGMLLEAHERVHGERAKYVIWARPSDEWIRGFERFFCDTVGFMNANESLMTFGVCDLCDERSEVRAANMRIAQATYERHLAYVDAYFSASPSRSERLLYMNLTDDQAGRTLCEFIFSPGAARCANLTNIPDVDQEDVACSAEGQRGNAAWDEALPGVGSASSMACGPSSHDGPARQHAASKAPAGTALEPPQVIA